MKPTNKSVVKKLYLREVIGCFSFKLSGLSRCRIYDKCPEHLQISLRNIISQKNLLLGHVIIGFTRDGKHLLSYQCRIVDDMDDGCPYLEYKYSLHWWEFHYKKPSKKVHMVPLFAGEDIHTDLHLLICQTPCGNYIIVHGSTSRQNDRSSLSSSCYVSIAPSPGRSCVSNSSLQNSFAIHLKYELVPPHPPFMPSVNLKLNNTILLNSGDVICAVNSYMKNGSDSSSSNGDALFGPIPCMPDCLCGNLPNKSPSKTKSCLSCSDNKGENEPTLREHSSYERQDHQSVKEHFLSNDSTTGQHSNQTYRELNSNKQISLFRNKRNGQNADCGCHKNGSSNASSSVTNNNNNRHTSCYLYYYSHELGSLAENSPFDCTNTAFSVKVSSPSGVNVEQIYSHRCFLERPQLQPQLSAIDDANLVVKQTVLDAEQFLDGQFHCMESIKDRFVSLQDYDMQIVQVCPWTENVIILIKALIHLRGKIGASDSPSNSRLSTYITGFVFSWNVKTSEIDVLEEHPVVEFQKPKCKSRSLCHGLEQAVQLKKRHYFPANLKESILSFSNHTVLSGKSMKYLLHPFQPLAIVM